MTKFAPVPDFALGPDIPESGYAVRDLGGGAYFVTQGMINTMFVETNTGVVLVDASPFLGDKLLEAIESVTPKPVTHLIYSHAHADHIGAAHLLKRDDLKIISHEITGEFIKEVKNDDRRPLPTETFSGRRKEMDIDGVRFVLDYTGDWHQAGNLFIHLPELKLMGAMDSFTPKNAPFFRLYFSAHVPAYFDAMDQLLEYDYETIVTGHMALPGTPEDVATNREYIRDLRAAASEALRTVDMREASAAAKVPANNKQAEIKVWMDAVTARAAELMPSWEKRLGGTDIFLSDNLNATAWSVFID
ncbi:MBL fold metallo-hydrolase [Streptomyces echinatus]|uniref:Glyoxylase-like metal-dependent hydrolase (Beta-lactamase superfamily II) n=1 Tax=Streptomyces echinatus TaxID=67293 RepID=A0A7W9PPV5_9ACTN|nr:MBL fold metallo-hydrolase [Streptomyces echinatus]MBB5925655.1 glyoxylase-like metal-dependent hydrolase (beta-lactamase superfamily II) [Streptomyces echinatus]